MATSPSLWLCFGMTIVHVTIFLWGAVRLQSLITFCQAVNRSERYPYVKSVLLILLYLYTPLVVISVTLLWIGYDQSWSVGYFFLVFPFFSLIGFVGVVLVSKNDVSNFVDISRAARSKLPVQTMPPPLVVGVAPPTQQSGNNRRAGSGEFGSLSPPRSAVINMAPPLPVRDGNVVDDEDAF